jgi:hypothetical protein
MTLAGHQLGPPLEIPRHHHRAATRSPPKTPTPMLKATE